MTDTKDTPDAPRYDYTHGVQLSIIIPCKDKNDPNLDLLLSDIYAQDFPKSQYEILVIDEGTSESAKAIGIERAKGVVILILASDNRLSRYDWMLSKFWNFFLYNPDCTCAYSDVYGVNPDMNHLNRYFGYFGCNDPLALYMDVADKRPWYKFDRTGVIYDVTGFIGKGKVPTLGDNGFMMRKLTYEKRTDMNNFYHIDNIQDCLDSMGAQFQALRFKLPLVYHYTSDGNLFHYLKKRYHHALNLAFQPNRRWRMVDWNNPKDLLKLAWFILASLTLIHPLSQSVRGFLKVRDLAWFLHPIVCFLTMITYGILTFHIILRRMSQSSSVPMDVKPA